VDEVYKIKKIILIGIMLSILYIIISTIAFAQSNAKNTVTSETVTKDTYETVSKNTYNIDNNTIVLYLKSNESYVNDIKVPIDKDNNQVMPIIVDDRTLIPVRFIAESLGAVVKWDEDNQSVTVQKDNKIISMKINSKNIEVDNQLVNIDVAPHIFMDRTYLPLRALVESFNKKIFYDQGLIMIGNENNILTENDNDKIKNYIDEFIKNIPYKIYKDNTLIDYFGNINDAVDYIQYNNTQIIKKNEVIIWDNKKKYKVYQNGNYLDNFDSYIEAKKYALNYSNSSIYYETIEKLVWSNNIKNSNFIKVKPIMQNPDLPRGCEVTSLAMMLNYTGLNVDKNTLADQVKKDPTPYNLVNGEIYYGNPNNGFIGDMYTFNKPGLGVYHDPIEELAEKYLPNRIIDFTGSDFDSVLASLSIGHPVWVITNVTYNHLDDQYFTTWHTPDGDIQVTRKEHSVLVVGYDDQSIYINDPMGLTEKVSRNNFIQSWIQMGSQAISYVD
jgi:uncharacterized protein YvpB